MCSCTYLSGSLVKVGRVGVDADDLVVAFVARPFLGTGFHDIDLIIPRCTSHTHERPSLEILFECVKTRSTMAISVQDFQNDQWTNDLNDAFSEYLVIAR